MRFSLGSLGLVLLVVALLGGISTASAAAGFYISNGRVYDANGVEFVARGINHPHCWYTGRTGSIANIRSVGANAIRVVLCSGDYGYGSTAGSEITDIITKCKNNKLVCVLEVHDTTGYREDSKAVSLGRAADWWIAHKSQLIGHEAYVMINIGNEPYGNPGDYDSYVSMTKNAIQAMRNAGFTHTLIVDAPNWGQDWTNTMQSHMSDIFNSDSQKNVILSVHMYGVYSGTTPIYNYLNPFLDNKIPIMVGEFGWTHSSGKPDESTIMKFTRDHKIGWFAWSWSGNGGSDTALDMVTNFDTSQKTWWGNRVITGADGLSQTSVLASIYSSTSSLNDNSRGIDSVDNEVDFVTTPGFAVTIAIIVAIVTAGLAFVAWRGWLAYMARKARQQSETEGAGEYQLM